MNKEIEKIIKYSEKIRKRKGKYDKESVIDTEYRGTDKVSISIAELNRRGQLLIDRVYQKIRQQMLEHDATTYTYKIRQRGDKQTWHLKFYKNYDPNYDGRKVKLSQSFIESWFGGKIIIDQNKKYQEKAKAFKSMRGKILNRSIPWKGSKYDYLIYWENPSKSLRKVAHYHEKDLIIGKKA